MNKLSILSPLKITTKKQFDIFVRCLSTYKNIIQNENTEFLVVNESTDNFRNMVEDEIKSIKKNVIFLNVNGMVNSVKELIKKSKNKYIMFFLDDVELLFEPNTCINDCISVMDEDDSIDQIKIGGGKVHSSNEKQIDVFKTTHQPVKINNNIVWLNESSKEEPAYLISQWNSIMRSKLLKSLVKKLNTNFNNWDAFTVQCSKIYNKKSKETKIGWLNLSPGLYAWGRTQVSFENYKLNYDKNNRG